MRDRRSPQEINNQREQSRRNSSEGSFEQTSSSQQQQQRGSQQPGLGRTQSGLSEQSERSNSIDKQSGSSLEEEI